MSEKTWYYIKQWRQIRGMTQETLARRAKVERSTLVYNESGRHSPSKTTAAKYARVLGVSLRRLQNDPFARYD